MNGFQKQVVRLCDVLRSTGNGVECAECPIKEGCWDYSDKLTPEEKLTAPTCEELLLRYILTGEHPEHKAVE